MRWLLVSAVLALCSCAVGVGIPSAAWAMDAKPRLPWTFEATTTRGEVRVVPHIELQEEPGLDLGTFVGRTVPWGREGIRRKRTNQLEAVPAATALALPGAVNGELGLDWAGQFYVGRFPMGARDRVRNALRGKGDLDETLGQVAQSIGGGATLFTWINSVSAHPLSTRAFPGDVVETASGPVLIDHQDEPYAVEVELGVALAKSDGEVVLRYVDTYEAVLSRRQSPARAGRELARAAAAEVCKVWALDPHFDVEPRGQFEPQPPVAANR